jgi:thiamine-phosphate diphosphorylase
MRTDHECRIMRDQSLERSDALAKLTETSAQLERSIDVRLIPEKGLRLGFAINGARDKNGVAAVTGGIIRDQGKPHVSGPCAFGADEGVARIVLTVMKFDPRMRCAATLRFSRRLLKVIEGLLLECASFDPASKPPGISTMDWGIASCCEEGVPDVCYENGMSGKEPTIHFFGEDPTVVTNNIIMLSNRIVNIEL